MSIRARASRRRAFTLIEVMVATLILALLVFSLYRFISATLRALEASTQLSEERQTVAALTRFVQAQLNDLPVRGSGVLLGKANQFHELAADERDHRPVDDRGDGIRPTKTVSGPNLTEFLSDVFDDPVEDGEVLVDRPLTWDCRGRRIQLS